MRPRRILFYKDFKIESEFHEDWDKYNVWRYVSKVEEPVIRATDGKLSGRERHYHAECPRGFASPRAPEDAAGKDGSYIFGLKEGDEVTISGLR